MKTKITYRIENDGKLEGKVFPTCYACGRMIPPEIVQTFESKFVCPGCYKQVVSDYTLRINY